MSFGQNQRFLFIFSIQFFIGLSSQLPIQQENTSGWNMISGSGSSGSTLKHYASLQYDGSHRCAVVLLRENIALVAAHCLYDLEKNQIDQNRLRVVAGVQSRDDSGPHTQTMAIQSILIHQDFNINTSGNDNDIALIRLQGEGFTLNDNVHKVHVVSPRARNFTGSSVVTSGFSGSRDKLKHFETRVISNFRCNQMLGGDNENDNQIENENGNGVSSSMICTHVNEQSVVCPEDSGVPLIYTDEDGRSKIIGIVAREGGCAQNRPTVFTRISKFEGWIRNNYDQLIL